MNDKIARIPLFDKVLELGLDYGNYRTDLYLYVTEETTKIIAEYGLTPEVFNCNITKRRMYDIPFAYAPAWSKRF